MATVDALGARIAACQRLIDLFQAELHGLSMSCTVHPHVQPSYSPIPELQAAYLRGLEDGRLLLQLGGR